MRLNPKSVNALAVLPKRKYLQPRFGGADIGFVERGHDVKREAGQFQSDEDHEQLFAADEQHQSNGRKQNYRQVFAVIKRSAIACRNNHREKGEREADDFEQRRERGNH